MSIKFKAWDKNQKKMFQVERIDLDFETGNRVSTVHVIPDDLNDDPPELNIQDVELLQFTGMKDSKGVEIYEGHICRYWTDNIWKYGYVIRKPDGFCFKVYKPYHEIYSFQSWIPCPSTYNAIYDENNDMMNDKLEVLGTIYENPELLD